MGWKRSIANTVLSGLSSIRVWETLYRLKSQTLTVLAYHRVVGHSEPDFDTFLPNVSASPGDFHSQMGFAATNFSVITLDTLLAWLRGESDLPIRPLLITFDDGYRDNFEFAYPILRSHDLPAVLFATTGFIGSEVAFYWDQLAYAFHHTSRSEVSTAQFGRLAWHNPIERQARLKTLIAGLKHLPEYEKKAAVKEILAALTDGDMQTPTDLAMSWDEVRELKAHNIDIGGHTHTHPILTRLKDEEAQNEIETCLEVIERETGTRPRAFAYTNGLEADFSAAHGEMLRAQGVEAAFSLLPGPSKLAEVRARPYSIRRVMVHHRDNLARFKAKLGGAARWSQAIY